MEGESLRAPPSVWGTATAPTLKGAAAAMLAAEVLALLHWIDDVALQLGRRSRRTISMSG